MKEAGIIITCIAYTLQDKMNINTRCSIFIEWFAASDSRLKISNDISLPFSSIMRFVNDICFTGLIAVFFLNCRMITNILMC